jgi:hypothetical protein
MKRNRETPHSWYLFLSPPPDTAYFEFHCNTLLQMKAQIAQTDQEHGRSTSLCNMRNIVQTHNKVTLSMYFSKILLYGNVLCHYISFPLPPSPSHRNIFNRLMSRAVFVLVVLFVLLRRATAARYYNETLFKFYIHLMKFVKNN